MGDEITLRRVSWRGFSRPAFERRAGRVVGVTLGNFDGLHLGHQALFRVLQQAISKRGEGTSESILFTFHPHPRAVLAKKQGLANKRGLSSSSDLPITDLRSKVALAREFGFSCCVSAHFTKEFSELSAEEFVERFLVRGLSADIVVVGHDWAFGRDRAGSLEELRTLGQRHGFEVIVVPPVEIDGSRVSTTLLKEALREGKMDLVRGLLGRPYFLTGRVRAGEQRGALLGFPTANLEFPRLLLPKDGVYAGWAHVGEIRFPAVCNLGVRPTFGGGRRVLEIHVLAELGGKAEGSLYGRRVDFEFVQRIRDEKKFPGFEELKAQITHDVETARTILR